MTSIEHPHGDHLLPGHVEDALRTLRPCTRACQEANPLVGGKLDEQKRLVCARTVAHALVVAVLVPVTVPSVKV